MSFPKNTALPSIDASYGRLNGSLIKQRLENLPASQFYFCASTQMMDAIMQDLIQHGVEQHQFHFENFAVSSGNVSEGSFIKALTNQVRDSCPPACQYKPDHQP